jgi:hypothetical protein
MSLFFVAQPPASRDHAENPRGKEDICSLIYRHLAPKLWKNLCKTRAELCWLILGRVNTASEFVGSFIALE